MNIGWNLSKVLTIAVCLAAFYPPTIAADLATIKPVISTPDDGKTAAVGQLGQAASPPPETVEQAVEVRALPGSLDGTLMFNSNSPEVVQSEGILLSTFPSDQMAVPSAHLNKRLSGRFDLFLHHIAKPASAGDLRTLYLGLLLANAGSRPVRLDVLSGASYLSQPDAPFVAMPPVLENQDGLIFSGPGDRVMDDLLRGRRQNDLPERISLAAGESCLLLNLPVPVNTLTPPLNGRSALLKVKSSGPVYAASLAMYAPVAADGTERPPTLAEWRKLLASGALAGPREHQASVPGASGPYFYGRVSGVASGTLWKVDITDSAGKGKVLTLPEPGKSFCYVLSTVDRKTLGTNQIQSAPLLVRYPDSAYQAHGNYGACYFLTLPLYNSSTQERYVSVSVLTPLKESSSGLLFKQPAPERVFFRGTIRFKYKNDKQETITKDLHLVERQGELLKPLLTLPVAAGKHCSLQVEFYYPPDATPPQVLRIETSR